ncbi:MAG: hypothetical protein N3D11_02470 [Candidatus Sumerlaeia bacterium]|nr:hypothetical protein [Candidatus Sumerlaeia bacterium]
MISCRPVLIGLIGWGLIAAASWAAPAKPQRPPFLPVSEIRPGMKGYGLTVFNGTTPERFEAEVLGVMHNGVGAGIDMILVRLEHPRLRDIGVIAGMSGSPVYIHDRLVGAVAYGFTFSKVAIAGLTPIESMLDVYEKTPLEAPPRDIALGPMEFVRPGEPVSIEPALSLESREPVRFRVGDLPEAARSLFASDGEDIIFRPLSVPVMISACSRQTASVFEKTFRPLGMEPLFVPMGATAQAADTVSTVPLSQGSAIGIPYMLGGLSAGSIGTVTYLDGRRLVAFGHPATARGPVAYPMGAAQIHTTLPSVMRPFKMGEIVGLSGSIHQDRLTAVGGVIGTIPFMVPVTVRVIHEASQTDRTYRFKVIDHRLFAPRMIMAALVEACTAGDRSEGDQTAAVHYRIETDTGQIIEKNLMAASASAIMNPSMTLLSDLAPIYSNDFAVRSVRSVAAEVRLSEGLKIAELRSAFVDRTIVKPGETVQVSLYVRPLRKETERVTAALQIPAHLPNGRYNVAVCDARQREGAEIVRAPGLYRPRAFDDVVRLLRLYFRQDRLYILLTSPDDGVTIDGAEFDRLPPTIQMTLSQLRDREKISPTIGQVLAEATLDFPYIISGNQIMQIEVDRRGGR